MLRWTSGLFLCFARPGAHLVLHAFTALQAGEDLALDGLDPKLSLLKRGRLEVPHLAGQGHDDKLERLLLLWNRTTQMTH